MAFFARLLLILVVLTCPFAALADECEPESAVPYGIVEHYDEIHLVIVKHGSGWQSAKLYFCRGPQAKIIADIYFNSEEMVLMPFENGFALLFRDYSNWPCVDRFVTCTTHAQHIVDASESDSGDWWAQNRRMGALLQP